MNELEQISAVVAQINPMVPYQVPEVYFETLSSVVMARIAAGGQEENSLLQVAGKQMPQDIPAGYFDTLPESILDKVKAQPGQTATEELASLSPLLAGISKQNVYEVPVGYFDGFEGTVSKQLKEETKVVSIFSRKLIIRYAAAAVVFTMIAFGIDNVMKQQAIGKPVAEITEQQFNNELAALSDDAIVSYLKLTADSKDIDKISESIDHNKLPEESDYMDEEFLENFMKELEKTTTTTNTQIN